MIAVSFRYYRIKISGITSFDPTITEPDNYWVAHRVTISSSSKLVPEFRPKSLLNPQEPVRETQKGSAALLLTGSGKGIRESSSELPIVGGELGVVAMAFPVPHDSQME